VAGASEPVPGIRVMRILCGVLLVAMAAGVDGAVYPAVAGDVGAANAVGTRGAATSRPAAVGPLHRIRLPGRTAGAKGLLTPEGDKLYLRLGSVAINVWGVLVYFWPELLGGVTTVTVLVVALALRRIARRPRLAGELHWRKCNYCLKGVPSERCPECGAPARRAVRGRRLRWRAVPAMVPMLAVTLGYGGLWAWHVPRNCAAKDWVEWWSFELEDWAAGHGVSLARWHEDATRIVLLDVARGTVERTVFTGRGDSVFPIALAPDGRQLAVLVGQDVVLMRAPGGLIQRRLSGTNQSVPLPVGGSVAEYSADGRFLYLAVPDFERRRTRTVRRDVMTGHDELLLETDTDGILMAGGGSYPAPRTIHVLPGDGPLRLLEVPNRLADDTGAPTVCRVHIVADPIDVREVRLPPRMDRTAIATDGRRAWFHTDQSRLVEVDLQTGQVDREIGGPPGYVLDSEATCDAQHRWLLVQGRPIASRNPQSDRPSLPVLLVYDVARGEFIGRFLEPASTIGPSVCAPTGRFVAVNVFVQGGRGYVDELLIYDLTTLPHDLTAPVPAELAETQPARP